MLLSHDIEVRHDGLSIWGGLSGSDGRCRRARFANSAAEQWSASISHRRGIRAIAVVAGSAGAAVEGLVAGRRAMTPVGASSAALMTVPARWRP